MNSHDEKFVSRTLSDAETDPSDRTVDHDVPSHSRGQNGRLNVLDLSLPSTSTHDWSRNNGPAPQLNLDIRRQCFPQYSSEDEGTESSSEDGDEASDGQSERADAIRAALVANDRSMSALEAIETELNAELERLRSGRPTIGTAIGQALEQKEGLSMDEYFERCVPYFQDSQRDVPPRNQDYLQRMERNEYAPYEEKPYSPWSNNDKRKLKRVVDMVKKKQWKDRNAKEQVERRGAVKIEQEEEISEEDYDWDLIAEWFNGRHSAQECRGIWLNHILPNARGKSHTARQERSQLRRLVEKHDGQNWEAIAAELGTGRSALQCLVMHASEQHKGRGVAWTPEENERLNQLVEENRKCGTVDWARVSFGLEDRDPRQCAERWRRSADPRIKRGPFDNEENVRIVSGVREWGRQFSRIAAEFVPGRTGSQVRDHYARVAPGLVVGNWTEEEDIAILRLVGRYGSRWRTISEHFAAPARSRVQVRNRYLTLQRWMSDPVSVRRRHLTRCGPTNLGFGRRPGRKPATVQDTKFDVAIDRFLTANYVEGRETRRPGSLRTAFELPEDEIAERTRETEDLLNMLGAKLERPERVAKMGVSVSNHDKTVISRIVRNRTADADVSPITPHADFLLPDADMLDGLLTVLLDPYLEEKKRKATTVDTESEDAKAAEELWMERLKTIYLYPILLPPSEVRVGEPVEGTDVGGEGDEAEEGGKKRKRCGRPPKKRRKKPDDQEAAAPRPKRAYNKTGKYSKTKAENLEPRISLRNLSNKADTSREVSTSSLVQGDEVVIRTS